MKDTRQPTSFASIIKEPSEETILVGPGYAILLRVHGRVFGLSDTQKTTSTQNSLLEIWRSRSSGGWISSPSILKSIIEGRRRFFCEIFTTVADPGTV